MKIYLNSPLRSATPKPLIVNLANYFVSILTFSNSMSSSSSL